MSQPRVLSGIQPTNGSFHLGNYLGAVKQWVELQENHDAFYCVVDLHALTSSPDPKQLHQNTLTSVAQLLALGVDPERCTLFLQSHVPAHNQLGWVMECLTGFGEASRMTQFKDKSLNVGNERIGIGVFTYPMLMAADILLYQADRVPVGEDQRQHIELARDLAARFNGQYGKTFTIPEGYILKAGAKIYDLADPTSKMSKSAQSQSGLIEILDAPEANAKKIKGAMTDTGREIHFDPSQKPGISNLLTIFSALTGRTVPEIEDEYVGKGYGDFKGAVAEVVVEYLRPIRTHTLDLLGDPTYLAEILRAGAQKAEAVANTTLAKAYEGVGLVARG